MKWIWIGPMHLAALVLVKLAGAWHVGAVDESTAFNEYMVPQDGWAKRLFERFGFVAITPSARVIIWRDWKSYHTTALLAHEAEHTKQHRRFGPFFLPVYLACSAWAWVTGRGAYRGNALEVAARKAAGE